MLADASTLLSALSNFGAFGILVAFLIWRDLRTDKSRSAHEAERLKLEERQLAYNRERLEADKALAAALAALTGAVQGGRVR